MSLPNNLGAYEDCVNLFERALQAKKGIQVSYTSHGDAYQLFSRLHYTRKLLREKSMTMHTNDDPRYNTTTYDLLIVRRPREVNGEWWVFIEQRVITGKIEELV